MAKTQKGLRAMMIAAAAGLVALAVYEERNPPAPIPAYDAARAGELSQTPASDWAEGDVDYVESLAGADLPPAQEDHAVNLLGKWIEHDSGWVTSEEQQAIAKRIADGMPREFAVHVTGVQGFDGGLTVTLKPEVQDVWWSIDCDIKRDLLDEIVEQWRTALAAAREAKGSDRVMVDVTLRTKRGPLAIWDSYTGADIFPLARCGA